MHCAYMLYLHTHTDTRARMLHIDNIYEYVWNKSPCISYAVKLYLHIYKQTIYHLHYAILYVMLYSMNLHGTFFMCTYIQRWP